LNKSQIARATGHDWKNAKLTQSNQVDILTWLNLTRLVLFLFKFLLIFYKNNVTIPPIMDLKTLISKCNEKDTKAWDIFYRKYKVFILKCVKYKLKRTGITPGDFDAMDITHDIFHSIWDKNKLEKIENPLYLKSWLSIFSLNFTRNYLRKHYYKKTSTLSLDTTTIKETKIPLKEIIPDTHVNITGEIDYRDLYSWASKAINALPKKQKIAIKLNILFGKKHVDISRIMNLPLPTVSSLILRAKKIIRKKMIFYFQDKKNEDFLHENP
jgi:RNA polymerase sigma-70 factor (ECF subfamily)